MSVYSSGDVSLDGASFSECTAGNVRLPRPYTLASPAHARSHAIAAAGSGRGRQRDMVRQTGDAFPKRAALGPARPLSLSDALPAYACPPQLAQRGGGMYVYNSGDVALESARFVECTSGSQAVSCRAPPPQEGAQTETGDQTVFFCRLFISMASSA